MKLLSVLVPLVVAAGVAIGGAAQASTAQYDFRAAPGETDLGPAQTFTEGGITVTATGATAIVAGDDSLGFYQKGLGVGTGNQDINSPGRARVGLNESIILEFDREVRLNGITGLIQDREHPQVFGLFVGTSEGVRYAGTFSFDGKKGTSLQANLDVNIPLVGDTYQFIGLTPDVNDGSNNAFRQGALFDGVEISPVPVPPAAPLLGAGFLLLVWRARKVRAATKA